MLEAKAEAAPIRKPTSPPEGHAGQDDDGGHGLELRQHEEDGPPGHTQGAEHGENSQLPGPGPAALEGRQEGEKSLQYDKQADKIIFPVAQKLSSEPYRQRHGQERHGHEDLCLSGETPLAPYRFPGCCFSRAGPQGGEQQGKLDQQSNEQ